MPLGTTTAEGISPAFLGLLAAEPLKERAVLDVGAGRGRLALALAGRCRRVVGIDRDVAAIAEAVRRAGALGLANVEFIIADAEAVEYGAFAPDLVAAHLCMSDAIAERAGRALGAGQVFAFVAFHADQWRGTRTPPPLPSREAHGPGPLHRTGVEVASLAGDR